MTTNNTPDQHAEIDPMVMALCRSVDRYWKTWIAYKGWDTDQATVWDVERMEQECLDAKIALTRRLRVDRVGPADICGILKDYGEQQELADQIGAIIGRRCRIIDGVYADVVDELIAIFLPQPAPTVDRERVARWYVAREYTPTWDRADDGERAEGYAFADDLYAYLSQPAPTTEGDSDGVS